MAARLGGTRCNLTHCGWWADAGLRFAPVDRLAWRENVRELRISVEPAGSKGLGVFAAQPAGPGRWVCSYEGELLNLSQLLLRYRFETPTYVYRLSRSLSIDSRDTSHFSRYINHDSHPNLHAKVNRSAARIDFYAIRPISMGTELTIDYGVSYWSHRAEAPAGGTESRLQRLQLLPPHLPRRAPVTAAEASTALSLPTRDGAAAFLRSRGRARGLQSEEELAALPLEDSRVRPLLLRLLSPSTGPREPLRAPRPSRIDEFLAWQAFWRDVESTTSGGLLCSAPGGLSTERREMSDVRYGHSSGFGELHPLETKPSLSYRAQFMTKLRSSVRLSSPVLLTQLRTRVRVRGG